MIAPFLMTEPGLWVYMDEQQDEAINLVNDNEYTVINKIDVKKFYKSSKNTTSDTSIMNAAYIKTGITVFSWLLGVFILLNILKIAYNITNDCGVNPDK